MDRPSLYPFGSGRGGGLGMKIELRKPTDAENKLVQECVARPCMDSFLIKPADSIPSIRRRALARIRKNPNFFSGYERVVVYEIKKKRTFNCLDMYAVVLMFCFPAVEAG